MPTRSRACVAEPLRLGLVGCGRIASAGYLPALERAPSWRLAAVADPDPVRRGAVGASVPGFPGLEELLAAGVVDAVVVASPPARHLADATLASAAGVPALVEKPPGLDLAEARALARLDPPPWLGLNRRFDGRWLGLERTLQQTVAKSLPLRLRLSFTTGAWHPHEPGADALLDLGVHLVDLALLLGGAAASVRATELTDARARLVLTLDRGEAELQLAHEQPYRESAEVTDASGRTIAGLHSGAFASRLRDRLRRAPDRPLPASLARQLEALAAAMRGDAPARLATAADGLATMRVLDAARRSAANGGATVALD